MRDNVYVSYLLFCTMSAGGENRRNFCLLQSTRRSQTCCNCTSNRMSCLVRQCRLLLYKESRCLSAVTCLVGGKVRIEAAPIEMLDSPTDKVRPRTGAEVELTKSKPAHA